MADDILLKIKQAEEDSNKAVADAKSESTEIIRNAKNEAENEYKRIIAEANSKAKSLIDEAQTKADADRKPILADARKKAEQLNNIDHSNVDSLINHLTERIVSNGNS